MKKSILFTICSFFVLTATAQNIIKVSPEKGDMTTKLQVAVEKARSYNGKAVVIEL